jgi:beta-galactosidase
MRYQGVFLIACMTGLAAFAGAEAVPSDPSYVRSLNGRWRFKLEQKDTYPAHGQIGGAPPAVRQPDHPEAFHTLDYREDGTWRDLAVPSNWEMSGVSPATYNQPDNAIGLYRLSFEVPASWKGRIVKINFDGVQNGAELYLNGRSVNVDEPGWGRCNYHEGGFDAFQVDLTPAVRFGQKNLLALRVTKNTKSVDLDTGDYFFLGGVHRDVTLFSVPATHIRDFSVRTSLVPASNKAELRVLVDVTSPTEGTRVSMQLEGHPRVEETPDSEGHAELVQMLDNPRLWSAEHPNLYQFRLDLADSRGCTIEHVRQRVGVREVSIRDGILLVNNVPVKLTGMCRHDVSATLGSAMNEEAYRKDLMLMKAANVNAVRTSHYPYASLFYDLCDELGLYVADEMAACWCPTGDSQLAPAFAQRAREMVRRDKNHPSIIIWAVGNENKRGGNNKVAADEIRKIDPTRPRLISWHPADEGDVELDDAHYTDPKDIAKANGEARRKQYPKSYLENPNNWDGRNGADYGCWDRWAAVIDRTWQEVWKADHVPGSFLWEWQDRAVADKCPTKLYDYFPSTGINLAKVKGIVDAFRNPRPWYYHVKMAYAPIVVDLRPQVGDGSVTVRGTNRYSFTDLSELKTTWHLLKNGRELDSASTHVALAPRTTGELRLDLPMPALAAADTMRLDFDHPEGRNVATYQFQIRPVPGKNPPIDRRGVSDIPFPKLNLVSAEFRNNRIGWREAIRRPGRLVNISVQRSSDLNTSSSIADDAMLYTVPLADVRSLEADVVQPDISTTDVVAHVRAEYSDGQFAYQVDWLGGKADIQELGWIFRMPRSCDRFSWNRQPYWSYYPADHIGRPSGTATPDSADVDVTKITRPDAFDFNSTKYDCDWATLTNARGRGLGVVFDPEARHHCRAGTSGEGSRELVVNRQCSPPRDLSSGIVPDYYLTFKRASQAKGCFAVGGLR